MNIDHTSHFVTMFFLFFFLQSLSVLLFRFLSLRSLSFVPVRTDKSFILYFPTVMFQCELMTVFVIVVSRALLVVLCWNWDMWLLFFPSYCSVNWKSPVCFCLQSDHCSHSTLLALVWVVQTGWGLKRIYRLNLWVCVAYSDISVDVFPLCFPLFLSFFPRPGAPYCSISHATEHCSPGSRTVND